jgi:hypothetical protein
VPALSDPAPAAPVGTSRALAAVLKITVRRLAAGVLAGVLAGLLFRPAISGGTTDHLRWVSLSWLETERHSHGSAHGSSVH